MSTVDFDPFSRDFFDDPSETYARLREEAPCFHSEQLRLLRVEPFR